MRNRDGRTRRPRRPFRSFFTAAEWLRLGICIGLLVAIVATFDRIQKPGFWASLFPAGEIDTALKEDPQHSTIVGVQRDQAEGAAQAAAEPPLEFAGGEAPREHNPLGLVQTDECHEIDKVFLNEVVKDKTPDRVEESEVIYQIMCVAATTPPQDLAKLARRDVLFANLFHDPSLYRGSPIRLRGVLRSLIMYEGKDLKNPFGFSRYFEGWVFTEDQPGNPTRVLFARIPEGMKPGERLSDEIVLDAFFFKLYAYRDSQGNPRAAPMLIGFEPKLINLESGSSFGIWELLAGIAAVGLLVVIYLTWQHRRDQRIANQLRPMVPPSAAPPDFEHSPSKEEL